MEATERHDYGYFNDVHIRIAGMAGLIDADNVGIVDSVVLSRIYEAETELVDEGEMIRSLANFATYKSEQQMTSSVANSLRNKNIDIFLYTTNQGEGSEWVYKDGDEITSRTSQLQILNIKELVFEQLNWDEWNINSNENNGYQQLKVLTLNALTTAKLLA